MLELEYTLWLVLREFIMLWIKPDLSYILNHPNIVLKKMLIARPLVSFLTASCCDANFAEQLAHSPVIKVNNSYWNRCGQLSKS